MLNRRPQLCHGVNTGKGVGPVTCATRVSQVRAPAPQRKRSFITRMDSASTKVMALATTTGHAPTIRP